MLVEWEERMGSFLRKPAFPVKASVDPTFQPGDVVAGRFRILRQAGSGGVA